MPPMLGKLAISIGLFGSGILLAQTAPAANGEPFTAALLALLEYGVLGIAVVLLVVISYILRLCDSGSVR